METKKVLFVCSGNTCRSPMAEGLFNKFLSDNKIDNIVCESAGVSALNGDCASLNAIFALQKRGIDISNHRASHLNPQKIMKTDLFVCMSEAHKKAILPFCHLSQIMVLDVNDPYMQSLEVYEKCARQIEEQFPDLLLKIQNMPVVRRMAEEDTDMLAELEKECFSIPWSKKSFCEELSNGTARFFVIKNNNQVCGYVGSNNISGEIYITNIAVFEQYRKKGYGERLLRRLITQGYFENAQFITLEVRESNEKARRLYEKTGFKQVGVRNNFYSKPNENGILYTLYLK